MKRTPVAPGIESLRQAVPVPQPAHVYRWDLDKTYLRTEFDTLKQLLRSAFESAEDKRTVPGAAALLRELRAGSRARICFISGSPRQMRKTLVKKFKLDGVEFDEFILKPNLQNMLTGRFRAMREQVGYKLPALLAGRAGLPASTRETCFGDDAEADGFIYSLYGDLTAGRVSRDLLEEILHRANVYHDDAQRAVSLAEALPAADSLERIFIHLDRRSPPSRFDRYGPRLVPIFNYFQATLVLLESARLDVPAVIRIVLEMIDRFEYATDPLLNSVQDLLRRGHLRRSTAETLAVQLTPEAMPALGSAPAAREALVALGRGILTLGDAPVVSHPDAGPIDFLAALEADLPRHRRKK